MTHEDLDRLVTKNIEERYSMQKIPHWRNHVNYVVGDRVLFNGDLYRCRQHHTAVEDWIPTEAQSLWEKIS